MSLEPQTTTPPDNERFVIVSVVASYPFNTDQIQGTIDLVVQRRKKEDGKLSREFLSVRITLGAKIIFLRPEVVQPVNDGLTKILELIGPAQEKLSTENEQRRKDRQVTKSDFSNKTEKKTGLSSFAPENAIGKTAKKKAKIQASRPVVASKKSNWHGTSL